MIARPTKERPDTVRLRYELDASPSKVWRAIRMPDFRDVWLPAEDLADPEPISEKVGQEICYRMRERTPPYLESAVTFGIEPNGTGGTVLRVSHELINAQCDRLSESPANSNDPPRMLAA